MSRRLGDGAIFGSEFRAKRPAMTPEALALSVFVDYRDIDISVCTTKA
jgi:hypothetical protein